MFIRRLPFAVSVVVSLVVLFAPASDVPGSPPGVDKLVHLGLFALLAGTGRWAGLCAGPLAAGLVTYAVASELIQAWTPLARDGSVADLGADTLGVLAALGVTAWWRWRRPARRSAARQ